MHNEPETPSADERPLSEKLGPILGVTLGLMMAVTIGAYAWHAFTSRGGYGDCYPQDDNQSPDDYKKWQKPLLALALTGQMHGYVDPCGCSHPQYGGLPRRYNFLQSLKAKNWNVVGIDLGEMAHNQGIPEQDLLRFDLTVKSLARMNYRAFGIGKNEILLRPALGAGLAMIWDQKNPYPRPISLTLADAAPGRQLAKVNARPFEIISDTNPKIGVISIIGPDLCAQLPQEKYLDNVDELPKALKAFADAGVEFGVILQHEHPTLNPALFPKGGIKAMQKIEQIRTKQARDCAKFCADERQKNPKIPPIYIIMSLVEDPEPSFVIRPLDPKLPTQKIEIGHKGKYVGLVGIYRDTKGFRLEYQPVLMSPDWETKKADVKGHPIIALFENYTRELKNQNIMALFPRSPHYNQLPPANQTGLKATFVGSERCGDCHDAAFKVWKKKNAKAPFGHAYATNTLENVKHPSNRQYDPECMKCHTTGMMHPGGYNDLIVGLANWPKKPAQPPSAKKIKANNDALRGVGCESCHGPGSEHVKNPNNKALYALINPFGPSAEERQLEALANKNVQQAQRFNQLFNARMQAMTPSCMKCHDAENDVHFGEPGHTVVERWHKIIHRIPNRKVAPAPPAQNRGPRIINEPPPVIEVVPETKKR